MSGKSVWYFNMSKGAPNPLYGPAAGGTSLVDRMNLSIHLRKYIKMFGRRLWIVILCVAIGGGYSFYEARKTPDVFQATSTLGIKPQLKTPYDSPVYMRELAEFHEAQMQYLRTITGRVNEKLADYQSPTRQPGQPKPQVRMTNPSLGPGSTFILTVQGDEFDLVQQYARLWAREFIRFKTEQKKTAPNSKVIETRNEISRIEKLLEQNRRAMDEFRIKYNIGSVIETGQAAQANLNRRIEELNALVYQRRLLENTTAEELAATTKKSKDDSKAETGPLPGSPEYNVMEAYTAGNQLEQLKFSLLKRKAEMADWSDKLLPEHPYMQKIQRDIDSLERDLSLQEKVLAEKRQMAVEAARAMQLAQIETLRKTEAGMSKYIADLKTEVQKSYSLQNEYKKLEDEELRNKDILRNLRDQEALIDRSNATEDIISIMEEGAGSPSPVAPNRPKIIMNGVLGGFGLGLAIVFLLHRLDDRLELAEDIEEELEEPVLGQIPQEDLKSLKDGRLLVTNLDEHSMFAESIRGVRSAILFGNPDQPKKTIITTSAVPGDGKTTFTVNFAATLAGAGNRVLLVDCDLRRGNIHGYFQAPREPGLTEVLGGQIHWSDVVLDTTVPTLKIISTGKLPGNPGELLISPAMEEFVKEAREEYDHILFDCPPLTAIDDTFCLMNLADGMLFVVKAGQTSMRFAKNALALVRQRGAHIFGIVLNGITTDHPSYYYNYYYHAYYRTAKDSPVTEGNVEPAKKMASRSRRRLHSIEVEAHARSGKPVDTDEIATQESKKAEDFKARRALKLAQQKPAAPTDEDTEKSTPRSSDSKN
jgi:polysaccharide biosynthesis transport protein